MKKILLLINPNSRSGEQADQEVRALLSKEGFELIPLDNHESRKDPNELILKYRDQCDVVIVGGGDGSVNLALPGLVKTQKPLIVLPLGTANNLARNYNIPKGTDSILELLKNGREVSVDLGSVNDILFINVAGLGLSTEVNLRVSKWLKKHLGVFAFVITAFQLATKMNPFRATISCDGQPAIVSRSWQISVCNGRHYGNGLVIKDDANLHDNKLHCLSTEVKKWWQSLSYIPSLMSGKYKNDQQLLLLDGTEILIKTRRTFQIDVDGDIKTTTPATFKVLPDKLRMIVPLETPPT